MTSKTSNKGMSVTVDIVIFAMAAGSLHVLLVNRKFAPFKGQWAIPGGFVHRDEGLDEAARRELEEETGLGDVFLEQLYTFGTPHRDPRGRVITVAYLALLPRAVTPQAGTDAADARWFPVAEAKALAFDHDEVLASAVERLRNKLEYTTACFELLPPKFTLSELQRVFESVLSKSLDKRNFRRKIDMLDVLEPLDEFLQADGPARPARLYKFSHRRFARLKDKGMVFPFFTKGAR